MVDDLGEPSMTNNDRLADKRTKENEGMNFIYLFDFKIMIFEILAYDLLLY